MVLLLPLSIQADIQHHERTQGCITARCMFIHKTWPISNQGNAPASTQASKLRLWLHALHRADAARAFLLRRIALDRLDAVLLLHTGDAARSALLAGTLQRIAALPPILRRRIRLRILPDFFRAHTTVRLRCIIRVRLGTIILTATMLLACVILEQRQQEKARTAYGTSHW